MLDLKPWECHADLTEDRLGSVARFFANTAREVVALHAPENGDDSWSLGCRRNSWWRNRLLQIVRTNDWPWLGVVSPTKGFVFTIGMVPIRFYRGQPGRPPQTTLSIRFDELRQQSLAFGESQLAELKWRFCIETDRYGYPINVVFVGHATDGTVECYWPLPIGADVAELRHDGYKAPPEVEIPAPLSEEMEVQQAAGTKEI